MEKISSVGDAPTLTLAPRAFGADGRNRLEEATAAGAEGARALIETFYWALNAQDGDVLAATWHDDQLAQLNNPLGGTIRGQEAIAALYRRIFAGQGRLDIAFSDVVELSADGAMVFAGREHGSFAAGGDELRLAIRTTRVLAFYEGTGWRMVHHHGSIDDADLLAAYQQAVERASA